MNTNHLDVFREEVQRRNAVLFVGSGASAAMVHADQQELTSWRGLMKNAIRHLAATASVDESALEKRVSSTDAMTFFHVINEIRDRLCRAGEFDRWLKESVGSLHVHDPRLGEAIQSFGLPIVTTNYDDLLEQVSTYIPLSWRNTFAVREFLLRPEPNHILHLHGIWHDPESVVLDVASYREITEDKDTDLALFRPLMDKRWVFVGFGEGLEDPHFSELIEKHHSGRGKQPFVLLSSEDFSHRAESIADKNMLPLDYGEHKDLWAFLHSVRIHPIPDKLPEAPPDPLTWPEFEKRLNEDLEREPKNISLMSRTGIGWKQSFLSERSITRALFLDPRGITFHWDTRYQYVPTWRIGSQNEPNVTIEQRATEAEKARTALAADGAKVRTVDAPLPAVMWLLEFEPKHRVLYLEIPRHRATYKGNLYLRIDSGNKQPKEAAAIELYNSMFKSWFNRATA